MAPNSERLSPDAPKHSNAPVVVDVMCDAFRDYPVMRFVLGNAIEGPDDPRLRALVGLQHGLVGQLLIIDEDEFRLSLQQAGHAVDQ